MLDITGQHTLKLDDVNDTHDFDKRGADKRDRDYTLAIDIWYCNQPRYPVLLLLILVGSLDVFRGGEEGMPRKTELKPFSWIVLEGVFV